jgi:hypothetical protein
MQGPLGYLAGVHSLTVHDDGRGPALYAGGDFTIAGNRAARRLARWDGANWQPLGEGVDELVLALSPIDLSPHDTGLLAGGIIRSAGGVSSSGVVVFAGDPLPGDINADNQVSIHDLTILLSHYGTLSGAAYSEGDLDGDTDVDINDLTLLLAAFGSICS